MARSRTKGKSERYQVSGEVSRIISLDNGNWAYLFDQNGKLHHLKVDTMEFLEKCAEINIETGGLVVRALENLGWTHVIDGLSSCGENYG